MIALAESVIQSDEKISHDRINYDPAFQECFFHLLMNIAGVDGDVATVLLDMKVVFLLQI